MRDLSGPGISTAAAGSHLPPAATLDGLKDRTGAEAAPEPGPLAPHRVGWGFISLYALAYMSTSLLFVAPLLVTLPLKVNLLVGIKQAPGSLALVAGAGALLAMVGNPLFGKMSDRTASRWGMRRPWMVADLAGGCLGILVVALAPSIPVVLAGWCVAQLCTLAQSAVIVAASIIGGKLSDRTGRRKVFVLTASIVYGLALFVIATAGSFNGFLVGMATAGLGFGVYVAVDLALVVDVLPGKDNSAKDLGVFIIAGALPFSIAPAIAPVILAIGSGSYGLLYAVAGLCAIIGASAILPVRGLR